MLGDDSENMDSMNDSYNDLIDDAASEDTDIFEFLDGSNHSATAIPEHAASDEVPVSIPLPETTYQDVPSEAENSESQSMFTL
jgi:hypothetical protein